jgi:uncharacterized protein (DUF362 family)
MDRREFIGMGINLGFFAAASQGLKGSIATGTPDLVAVRNGEPAEMLDAAMEAYGGMKTFVKPGQRVCLKPNIGWDKPPEMAANTNPELVGRCVELCLEAGAREVVCFDHTCHPWEAAYRSSGIAEAVRNAGGRMLPGNDKMFYRDIDIPKGVVLKKDTAHQAFLESDVVINMPIIKHHGSTRMTISLKNLMGVNWDRGHWHQTNLNQCIADYASRCKPTLNIVDGYRILLRNGPIGRSLDDVKVVKALVVGTDMVAVDAAAVRIFGNELTDVSYLALAEELGVGTTDLSKLDIRRIVI